MLKDEFVYWKQAFDLKELGFNEPCFGYFSGDKRELKLRPNMGRINLLEEDDVETAPTYSQAFRFFREKYKLNSFIDRTRNDGNYKYSIYKRGKSDCVFPWTWYVLYHSRVDSTTYEKAELDCLKQLIKLAKDGTIQKQI